MAIRVSNFRGFPDLDIAAIRARLDRALALWYLARTMDHQGQGVVPLGLARTNWAQSRSLTGRALRLGEGTFWRLTRDRIFLASLGKVAKALGVTRLRAAYYAPIGWLIEHARRLLRAVLALNAFAVLREGKPIAIATIASACGVNRSTVFRWLRLTGWKKTKNLGLVRKILNADAYRLARKYSDDGDRLCAIKLGDELWLAVRLPNSLDESGRKVKSRAALRRANAFLLPFVQRGRGQQQRRYIRPVGARPYRLKPAHHATDGPIYVHDPSLSTPRLQVWKPFPSTALPSTALPSPITGAFNGVTQDTRRSKRAGSTVQPIGLAP